MSHITLIQCNIQTPGKGINDDTRRGLQNIEGPNTEGEEGGNSGYSNKKGILLVVKNKL